MRILHTHVELIHWRQEAAGPITFVPTMGALHEGHAALVRRGCGPGSGANARVIVSIFVNPTQFNDPKDLERYPRTLNADAALCEAAGAHAIYAPSVEDVYPPASPPPVPPLPSVATQPGLEDARRPGHFAGVCQVVSRLFDLVDPDVAIFGEKDWQQLAVIRAMVAQQQRRVLIDAAPTIREADGLAMSSRNRFIPAERRSDAAAIFRALRAAGAQATPASAEAAMARELRTAGLEIEYAVVRDAASLLPITTARGSASAAARVLIAARLGPVRLIDNAPWPLSPDQFP